MDGCCTMGVVPTPGVGSEGSGGRQSSPVQTSVVEEGICHLVEVQVGVVGLGEGLARCTRPPVRIAARNVRYRSSPAETARSTAGIVSPSAREAPGKACRLPSSHYDIVSAFHPRTRAQEAYGHGVGVRAAVVTHDDPTTCLGLPRANRSSSWAVPQRRSMNWNQPSADRQVVG